MLGEYINKCRWLENVLSVRAWCRYQCPHGRCDAGQGLAYSGMRVGSLSMPKYVIKTVAQVLWDKGPKMLCGY